MNKSYSLDGVQTILSYPFKAPGWQSKFLIGAALFFANYIIPIIPGMILMGYCAKITHDIIVENADLNLPEWADWGELLSRGAKVYGATIVYLLPVIVLFLGGYTLMMVPAFVVPFLVDSNSEAIIRLIGIEMLGTFGGMFIIAIGLLFSIPIGLMLPVAIGHVIAKDSFAAAFRIKEWWPIARANLWGFVTAIVIVSGVYISVLLIVQAFYLTIILCVLVPIILSVFTIYISLVSAAALGEAYRKGVENLAPAA